MMMTRYVQHSGLGVVLRLAEQLVKYLVEWKAGDI